MQLPDSHPLPIPSSVARCSSLRVPHGRPHSYKGIFDRFHTLHFIVRTLQHILHPVSKVVLGMFIRNLTKGFWQIPPISQTGSPLFETVFSFAPSNRSVRSERTDDADFLYGHHRYKSGLSRYTCQEFPHKKTSRRSFLSGGSS